MTIHCIGDSHASFFAGEDAVQPQWPTQASNRLPQFKAYRLGAVTAYNLCKPKSTSGGREFLFEVLKTLPAFSTVMLAFGEIDCRIHLPKRWIDQKKTLREVVNPCLDRYCSVIDEIERLGFRVLVWNVIPSTPLTEGVSVGEQLERNAVSRMFNLGLTERKRHLVSIFKHLVDETTHTNLNYYLDDKVHLSQRAMPFALTALEPWL